MKDRARGRTLSTEQRQFVLELVERLGLAEAAKSLGISELTTLSATTGRRCYQRTADAIDSLREQSPEPRVAGYLKDGTPVFFGRKP